jgi:hypothetical protein
MAMNRERLREDVQKPCSLRIFWVDASENQPIWDPDNIHIDPEITPQDFAKYVRRQVMRKFRDNPKVLDGIRRLGKQISVRCFTSGQFRRSFYLNPETSGVFRVTRLCDGFNDPETNECGFKTLQVIVQLAPLRRQEGKQSLGKKPPMSIAELTRTVEQTIRKLETPRTPTALSQIYLANLPLLTYVRYEPLITPSKYRPSEPLTIVALVINKTAEPRIQIPAQIVMELSSSINGYARIFDAVFKAINIYCIQRHNKELSHHCQDFMPKALAGMMRLGLWMLPQISDAELQRRGAGGRKTVYALQEHVNLEEFFDGREERELTMEVHLVPDDP